MPVAFNLKAKASLALVAHLTAVLVLIPTPVVATDPVPSVEAAIITVGTGPTSIAITADGSKAYVTNYSFGHSGTVSVIDLSTGLVTKTIGVGNTPTSIAISPNGQFAYVANFNDPGNLSSVSRIDLSNDTVSNITDTDLSLVGPLNIVFSPDGSKAYVSNRGSNSSPRRTISVINTASNTVTEVITLATENVPFNLAISSDGKRLYASHPSSGKVSLINLVTNSVTTNDFITGLTAPQGLVLVESGASNKLYIAEKGNVDRVSVYAITEPTPGSYASSLVTRMTGLADPENMALNGSATQMFVANTGDNNVRIIDLSNDTLLGSTLGVGSSPFAITFAPNGLKAYVANSGAKTVSVISYYQSRTLSFETTSYTVSFGATQTVTATPSAGSGVGTLTYSAAGSTACTVNASTGLVTMTATTGTCVISASITQGGTTTSNAYLKADTTTSVTITPTTAPLEITAGSLTLSAGASISPTYSITSGSLVSPDAISGLTYTYEGTGSTNFSPSATPPTEVGSYSITPSAVTLSSGNVNNYNITYNPGSLIIQQAAGGSSGSGGSSSGVTRTPEVVAPTPSPTRTPSRTTNPSQVPQQRRVIPGLPRTLPVIRPVERPGAGFDPNAPVRGIAGGFPTNVTIAPQGSAGVSVAVGAFQFGLTLREPNQGGVTLDGPSRSPELQASRGQVARVSGNGSYPGSFVQLWLPGTKSEPREIARIPVKSGGTFDYDLTLGANAKEMPLPIGRQVLQVVGYDERGNQTVVDMTINIGQGVPSPEIVRELGTVPTLSPGQSLATSAGIPESASIRSVPESGNIIYEGSDWTMTVQGTRGDIVEGGNSENPLLRLEQSSIRTVGGNGFIPGTLATVWLFSDPTLMASVPVDDNGEFSAKLLVDSSLIPPGQHTLQIQGVGTDGYIKAANFGVIVQEPGDLSSENVSNSTLWVFGISLLAVLIVLVILFYISKRRQAA